MKKYILPTIIGLFLSGFLTVSAEQQLLGGNVYIDPALGTFGVGTTSLYSMFMVSNSGQLQEPLTNTTAHFSGLDGNPLRLSMDTYNDSSSFGSQIQFRRTRGTTLAPTAVLGDDTIFSLSGTGWGDTGYPATSVGSISMHADGGIFTDTSRATYIRFNTSATTTITQLERMRITGDGYVGIGTTSPYAKLSVDGKIVAHSLVSTSTISCTQALETDAEGKIICGTDETGGGGGSDPFTHTTSFNSATTSMIGIGTTTPWGIFSIASTTYNFVSPLLQVSTSTEPNYGNIFSIFSTSTSKIVQSITGRLSEIGARIGVGIKDYLGFGGLLDQLVVRGRTNDVDWLDVDCDGSAAAITALSADGTTNCDGFSFLEDNTGTMTGTALTGGGTTFARVTASTAAINNDGAGVFVNGASAGWLTLGTSTPVMEVSLRIRNSTATTSGYYIGFSNIAQSGTTYEAEPTVGCFFVATSTANWRAVCKTANATATYIDTGVASTSSNATNGTGYQFRKFRIEADTTRADFYIQQNENSNLIKVASITGTYPATTLLNAGVHYGLISQNTSSGFDFFRLRFWWRDNLPTL